MLVNLLLLIGALIALTIGAELLVRGAAAVARRFGVSSFFIGLTIVGFGTSAPELATGISSALRGHADINVGNVVGSNIFNIAMILGVTSLLCPIPVQLRLVRAETPLVIGVAFVPLLTLISGGVITWWMGAAMFAGLLVYIGRGFRSGRRDGAAEAAAEQELERELGITRARSARPLLSVLLIALGLGALVGGSMLLVDAAVGIARSLGVSELVIALTIVSAGTSAPELVTSLVAAMRKQSDIAIGNIMGSNIFNIMGILGITSMIREQEVTRQTIMLDTPMMIAVSVALLPIMNSHSRISRAEGVFLLVLYAAYVTILFTLAPAWFSA